MPNPFMNPFDMLGEERPLPDESQLESATRPLARGWNSTPTLPFRVPFPDRDPELRGPVQTNPDNPDYFGRNLQQDWRAPLTKAQFVQGPDGQWQHVDMPESSSTGEPQTPAKETPAGSGKMPWEMTPEELGVKPAGDQKAAPSNKMPWEMTPEELGVHTQPDEYTDRYNGEPTATRGPGYGSGARGAPGKPVQGNRTSAYGRAERAGIGQEGVSAAARLNAALAWGAIGDPRMELEIARRAISRDLQKDYPIENLRIGPDTKELEWVNPKTGKWDRFVGGGAKSWFNDVAAALPEIGQGLAEMGAGIVGGGAGAIVGTPAGTPGQWVGMTGGNAAGAAAAAWYGRYKRLMYVKEQGLADLTDEQIFANAKHAAELAGGVTLGAATIMKIAKTLWQFSRGTPAELLETVRNSDRLASGKPMATAMEDRATDALVGTPMEKKLGEAGAKRFPMTAGQQMASEEVVGPRAGRLPRDVSADEVLGAEEAALRMRKPNQELSGIYKQQEQTMDAVDLATFANRDGRPEMTAGRTLQAAMEHARFVREQQGKRALDLLRTGKENAEQVTEMIGGRSPTAAVDNIRSLRADAREQLFFPFKQAMDRLEADTNKVLDLAPFRTKARELEKKYGQTVVDALNSADIPALQQAKTAGIEIIQKGNLPVKTSMPQSISDMEKLRKELTAKLQQLENSTAPGKPREANIIRELRDAIDETYVKNLQPEMITHMQNLREGYAKAVEQYDKGILGEIAKTKPDGVTPAMSSNEVIDYLLRDVDNVHGFIDAIKASTKLGKPNATAPSSLEVSFQPQLTQTLQAVQQGVFGRLTRQFKNYETGEWDTKGMAAWLQKNNESLKELFRYGIGGRGEIIDRGLAPSNNAMSGVANKIVTFQKRADAMEAQLDKQRQIFEKRFGVFNSEPAVLAKELANEARVGDLRRARALVHATMGEEGTRRFNAGLAQVVRNEVTDIDPLKPVIGRLNPEKIDQFLLSERGRQIGEAMGGKWTENMKVLADMMRIRQLQYSGAGPTDLGSGFTRGVPGLRDAWRFLRVVAPPMSGKGRGLTGLVGMMNDKTMLRISQLMGDPDALNKMVNSRWLKMDPLSRAGRIQLGKLGLEHVSDFWKFMKEVHAQSVDSYLDEETPNTDHGFKEQDEWEQYRQMGVERPMAPQIDGSVPGGGDQSFPKPPQEGDLTGQPIPKREGRAGENFPLGMNPVEGDTGPQQEGPLPDFGQGRGVVPQGRIRTDSGIATDANQTPEYLRQYPQNRVPQSRAGSLNPDFMDIPYERGAGVFAAPGLTGQQPQPADRWLGSSPDRMLRPDQFEDRRNWVPMQGSEYPKGHIGPKYDNRFLPPEVPIRPLQAMGVDTGEGPSPEYNKVADSANSVVDEIAKVIKDTPERWQKRYEGLKDILTNGMFPPQEGGTGKGTRETFEAARKAEQDRVFAMLEKDPVMAVGKDILPKAKQILEFIGYGAKGAGNAVQAIGSHIINLLDDAVYGDGEKQHRAAAELALIVTGGAGTRFAAGAERATLGAGGGLPPIKPPARVGPGESVRGRLEVIQGGQPVVEKNIDQLSGTLSRKLHDTAEMMKGGGSEPQKMGAGAIKKQVNELREASDNLMKEAESLSAPLTEEHMQQLKSMGMSKDEYLIRAMDRVNKEVDQGRREAFRLQATGRDAKMEVTPQNIKDWLEAAGVKDVRIEKSLSEGSKSEYVKFPDPSGSGRGTSQVRVSDHRAERAPYGPDTLDATPKSNRSGEAGKARTQNVEGGKFSEWENLIEALKFRLSKSPDGQWLISPQDAPLPRSFGKAYNKSQRAKALEAEREPTISRDPNQGEFNFGDQQPMSPFGYRPEAQSIDEVMAKLNRNPFSRLPRPNE